MKLRMIFLAGIVSPAFLLPAQAQAQLSARECQPLTALNKFECCNAPNWREIILPGSQARCDRHDANDQKHDDAVGSITPPGGNTNSPPDDGTGNNPPNGGNNGNGNPGGGNNGNGNPGGGDNGNGPPENSALGNPGNNKDVGRAGEKNMANEGVGTGHSSYGTRGNSNGDADGNPSGMK